MKKSIEDIPDFCINIKPDTGRKCSNYAIKGGSYCKLHLPNSPYVCAGFKRNGIKCKAFKRKDSLYCCADHDPDIERSTDPLEFRVGNLRSSKLSKILRIQEDKDCFSDEVIETWKKPIDNYHIDHFFELNLARDAFDRMRKDVTKRESMKLKDDVKITFNQEFNLGLTDEKINQSKTSAMQSFATDYKSSSVDKDGIRFYLRNSPNIRTRGIVSKIVEKVTTSVDLVKDHFTNNVEDSPAKISYLTELEEMVETWKL